MTLPFTSNLFVNVNPSIEATSKSCLLMLLVAVFLFLLTERKQKWWSHTKEHVIHGPGLRFLQILPRLITSSSVCIIIQIILRLTQ